MRIQMQLQDDFGPMVKNKPKNDNTPTNEES